MAFSPELCPACTHLLPTEFINRSTPASCPFCHLEIQTAAFPALIRKPEQTVFEIRKKEGEASCFYHPTKPAVAVCDFCGVFLSDLCDLQINGKHICPPCFDKKENKEKLNQADRARTLYDGIALNLALVPLIFLWFLSFFTALASLFVAIRYWKNPGSIIPRSKIRFILAITFASLQILGWFVLVVFIIYSWKSSS